jgi:DNA-binding beta-propeller fold protein YncE
MSRLPSSWARSSRALVLAVLLGAVVMALSGPPAWAGPGYQLDSSKPSIALDAEVPSGVAVDQASQRIYVAELSQALFGQLLPGEVEQLSPTGVPTADSPFKAGGQDFFLGVAVNPTSQGIYAYQSEGSTPAGQKGESKLSNFSSSGVIGTSFSPPNSGALTLASDSSGRIFFPNSEGGSVQVYSSSGTLEDTISCSGCPGGSFAEPDAVAFNSAGKLYVVDRANGRVVKLSPSGGTYVYESTLQNGRGAVAVAVDTSNDSVLVGDLAGGKYHVVAFDSSGTEFDDFGLGLVSPSLAQNITGQLAANATTHRLYLSDPGGNQLRVFERIASIPAPTASVIPASPVEQAEATLRAEVNSKGHVLATCRFEYTDHADFLVNGYANAKTAACPTPLGDPASTTISANVSGLSPATAYDYRIQVASHGGSDESGPQAFETLPSLPPEATTGSATAIGLSSATLGGSVNPKGGKLSNCHFEYIDEASFLISGFASATSKACATTPSGNSASSVSAKVSGLSAGTTYRFRVVATNNVGTTAALDHSFATVAESCATNSVLCLPPAPSAPVLPAEPPATPTSPTARKPLKCRKGFKKKRIRGKLRCVKVKKRHRRR